MFDLSLHDDVLSDALHDKLRYFGGLLTQCLELWILELFGLIDDHEEHSSPVGCEESNFVIVVLQEDLQLPLEANDIRVKLN